MEQWTDADAAYNEILCMIEHARTRLNTLLASPGADELDIASARADLAFHTSLLPQQPPSLQYQQALAAAQATRTAAAGGNKIVTEHDILTARGDAERADLATRTALRDRRQALRRELDRADRDVAAAFAAAQTATTNTLETLLNSARSELDLLRSAGNLDVDRTPLAITESALATHDPTIAARLKALAAQPYRLSYARAESSDPGTVAALHTLRAAANASQREVLWLSVTEDQGTTARAAELADIITTIDHAHEEIADQLWSLQPNVIVVVDNPAAADPGRLAAVTGYITAVDARAIILDPADGHFGPSTSALRLLANTMPWTTNLTATDTALDDHRGVPTPAITLADRLGRTRLSEPWRQLLTHYDTAARTIRAAHRLHLTVGWHDRSHSRDEPDRSLDASVDD
jgi:hypothetical protein